MDGDRMSVLVRKMWFSAFIPNATTASFRMTSTSNYAVVAIFAMESVS